MRGIFFEEEHARAVAARLERDGYDASVERERLAGEDDDEDHPWAVLTDAPGFTFELLIDQYDGWLDEAETARPDDERAIQPLTQPLTQPLDLPTAPRRIKRP